MTVFRRQRQPIDQQIGKPLRGGRINAARHLWRSIVISRGSRRKKPNWRLLSRLTMVPDAPVTERQPRASAPACVREVRTDDGSSQCYWPAHGKFAGRVIFVTRRYCVASSNFIVFADRHVTKSGSPSGHIPPPEAAEDLAIQLGCGFFDQIDAVNGRQHHKRR